RNTADLLVLTGALRRAIEQDELSLVFQPKVSFKSQDTQWVEALVRWKHPVEGILSPERFLPLAEQSGLMRPLTRWVLNATFKQCAAWRAAGHQISVTFNLSMSNLHDAELPNAIAALLKGWHLSPEWLLVEVTESSITVNPARVEEVIRQLQAIGLKL